MNGFVQGIFVYSVIAVIYPRISKLFITQDLKAMAEVTSNAMVTMALVVIPAMTGLMIFSQQIITLLFFGGAFDQRAVLLTSGAMFFYAPALLGYAFREIFSRIYYSMNDSRTPMINASIAVAVNVVLNLILSRFMGINGLALATSIASLLSALLLMLSLRRKRELALTYREFLKKLLKISAASILMGFASHLAFQRLAMILGQKGGVVAAIGVAILVYIPLILLLRIPEVDAIVAQLRQKLRKK